MIYDTFTYNGEKDILSLRFDILGPHVDKFVICESKTTFSGKPKPLYFSQQEHSFRKYHHQIIYYIIPDGFSLDEITFALNSGFVTNDHFLRAFLQKECIKKAIPNPHDDDVIFYGDVDEIWNPHLSGEYPDITKFIQLNYSLYLNMRSSEPWKGTFMTKWGYLQDKCVADLRANTKSLAEDGGWHFTNMGGLETVLKKLDSYDHQEVNTAENRALLEGRIERGEDFLGRPFKMWIDESEWPEFLKKNRSKYSHLCK